MSFLYDATQFNFDLGLYLNKAETVNITTCYIPTSETLCSLGDVCWSSSAQYNPNCNFFGVAEQFITSVVSRTFMWYNMTKICLMNKAQAENHGCDILAGNTEFFDGLNDINETYWSRSVLYDVDTTSITYNPSPDYNPWDFLQPFSLSLWLLLAFVILFLTPLVTSFIEYDEKETIVGNFRRYLPESIHAHLGIDILSKSGPNHNTSYTLAVFVNLFSMVIIFLYGCNLTAYVLYKTFPLDQLKNNYSASWTIFVYEDLITYYSGLPNKLIPISVDHLPILLKSGSFDAVIGPRSIIQTYKPCSAVINDIKGPGVYRSIDIASKLNDTVEYHIKNQMRKTLLSPITVPRSCALDPKPILLSSMYGIFIAYFVPVAIVTLIAIGIYVTKYYRVTKTNSELPPPKIDISPVGISERRSRAMQDDTASVASGADSV